MQLAETEYRVMNQVWKTEGINAREIANRLMGEVGWSKTTTYTIITRCIEKKYLRREDPGFRCFSLISRRQVAEWDTDTLINRGFEGCPDLLIASLLGRRKLSKEQIAHLKELVKEME